MSNIELRRAKLGDEKILAYIQTESWKSAFAGILSPEELAQCTNVEKNLRAIGFYEKHGFVLTEQKNHSHGAVEIMYSKKL